MHFRHLTCVISFTRAISLSSAFPSAFPSALVLPRADPDPGTLAAAYQDSNSSDYTPAELSGSKRLRTRDDDQAFTSAGNGTNFLSVTFPDVGDEPGVTINLESAFNAKRQVGFYQFFNGTTTRVATFGEIFDDINAASPRVVTSHVKTALLHLEDKFLDFYGAAKFECGWNSGPGRKLTQDNRGGHISLAIVKAATGGAVASAFYYAGITPNATLGERAVVAGGSFMMGSIIGSIFDSLQRRGFLNSSDAAITACAIAVWESLVATWQAQLANYGGQCFSEDDLVERAAGVPDFSDDGLAMTAFDNALQIAAAHDPAMGAD